MTILLVDSDKRALDREAQRLSRRQSGIVVVLHSSAADAEKFVMHHDVDVVYVRERLEEMTGQELVRRILRLCPTAECHVLRPEEDIPFGGASIRDWTLFSNDTKEFVSPQEENTMVGTLANKLETRPLGRHYTLYRLTEYKTLDGYELDMTPHYYVWGEANATEEETAAAMAEVLKQTGVDWEDVMFIPFGESKTDYIQNLPTTTEITVEKQWQGAEGTELEEGEHPDAVKVTLYQQTAEGEPVQYTAEGVENPVTLNAENNWTYTWKQLPKEDVGENPVTYTVEETPIDGWEARYVDENGEETTGIAEGTIQIINTKQSTFTLPETGGVGPTLVAIAGVPLIGAAGVVYRNLRRKRRRGGKLP